MSDFARPRYYVTVVNADRQGFLLGPYITHKEARENVTRGRDLACEVDAYARFYLFGTARTVRRVKTVFGREMP